MNARVAISEPIHAAGLAALAGACEIVAAHGPGAPDFADVIVAADACIVRTWALPADLLARAPALKVIAKHGVGIDAIDVAAATRAGIVVANTPGSNAQSVAESAVALIFALHRRLHAQHELVRAGNFAGKDALVFRELTGKTLGLVGGGNIGARIAGICRGGFAMPVLLFDPYMPAEAAREIGVEKIEDLGDLMAAADIVSVQAPLSEGTRGLIGRAELAAMKPGAILVNVARGGVIDEAALVDALRSHAIAGAGIDCFVEEPVPPDHPLLSLANVALSPHSGGSSLEGLERTATAAAGAVLDVLAGRKPAGLVNPYVWDHRRT